MISSWTPFRILTSAAFVAVGLFTVGVAPGKLSAEEPPDPSTWKWNDPKDLSVPGLRHATLESLSMKRTVGYNVYLPPQYEAEPNRRFPVVFFLHGYGGTESSDAGLAKYVHAEIVAGSIAPVIYVFPNGGTASGYRDWATGNVKTETLIVKELLPAIDKIYRTQAQANSRGICGFSMGGVGAIRLALKYPEMFGTAAALAAALDKDALEKDGDNCYRYASALSAADRERLYLYFVVGEDDFLFPRHEPFLRHLKALGIRYTLVVHAKVTHNLGVYTELSGRAMIEHLSRELERLGAHR